MVLKLERKPGASERDGPTIRNVPAVTRAIAIMRYLAQAQDPAGVNQVAAALGIVPSTCLHILRALTAEGLVAFDSRTKRYRLGIGVLSLARGVSRQELHLLVQPVLDRIARRNGVTSVFVQRSDPSHLIVAAVAEGPDMFSVKITVGTAFRDFSSASGRCVAAYSGLDDNELHERFSGLRWQNPPDFPSWLRQVQSVPETAHAIDDGNFIRGITVIAAPILAVDGTVDKCITGVVVKEQWGAERIPALVNDLIAGAREISRSLG